MMDSQVVENLGQKTRKFLKGNLINKTRTLGYIFIFFQSCRLMNTKGKKAMKMQMYSSSEESDQDITHSYNNFIIEKGRKQNSLSVLTKKFVELIKESREHVIDLNESVKKLKVQKRRIYDITNVLEGIGYVDKTHKNTIRWKGQFSDKEQEKEIKNYTQKISELEEQQRKLDNQIEQLNKEIKSIFQNEELHPYQFITYEDCLEIAKCLELQSMENPRSHLVILQTPTDSELEATEECDGKLQLTISSHKKKIKVYVVDLKAKTVQNFNDPI